MNLAFVRTAALTLLGLSASLPAVAASSAPAADTAVPRIVVVAKRIPVLTGEVPRIVVVAKRLNPVGALAQDRSSKPGRAS